MLKNIALTNFRSFAGEHYFEFPTTPGLYNITGENKDNPRLGRNGIGKSSLLEAAFWCLFGKTTRSLKGTDIITWGAKSCSVTVNVSINDKIYKIERKQSPNSLELDGKPVDQEAIQKAIRLGPEAFSYAVILPQFGDSFFDLTPSNKLALFSEIMELDFWLEKSQLAAATAFEFTEAKAAKERALAKTQGRLESTKADIKQLLLEESGFQKKQSEEVQRLKGKFIAIDEDLLKTEGQLARNTKALKGAEQRLVEAGVPKVTAGFNAETLRDTLAKIDKVGATCPTCLQSVPDSHLKAEKARLKVELAKTEAEVKKASEEAQVRRTLERNRDDFAREQRQLENRIFSLKKDIESLDAKIEAEGKAKNPYTGMIENKKQNVKELKSDIKTIQGDIDEISKDHAAINYWVAGFKRVRLFLVEETLKQLEIEVNNNLANLGLTDWRIAFDVERENKSGGVTKGFTVLIYAPGHKNPTRYEAYCGGETQRLRLAGDLGLANLIMERAGLISTFEAFDEPSAHMSQEGLLDLAETLADRAEAANKVVLLVDHNNIDYGGFAGTVTIVKDKNGSRIK